MKTPTKKTTSVAISRTRQTATNKLLALKKITHQDLEPLDDAERIHLANACTKILKRLKDTERDDFIEKIEQIMLPDNKKDLWDYNHSAISETISAYMHRYGIMPNQKTIAELSGLSRQTVAKHCLQYKHRPEYSAEIEQFRIMAPSVLANVFKNACKGDMKAARLYLEMIGTNGKQQNNHTHGQNNYIQINNTILSQENLTRLTAEQLTQIEGIINGLASV